MAAIRLMIVWRLTSGLPRQLMLMKEKRRCSILFHLLVPGGKWQTRIARPVWSASCCSSVFQRRVRLPFGAAAVGSDRQGGGVRVALCAELLPPAADRLDGELGGVVVDPDVDPADVVGEVVDAVGGGLAQLGVGVAEVVRAHPLR